MSPPALQPANDAGAPDEALPPELLAFIEALAEAQARRDYAARFAASERTS